MNNGQFPSDDGSGEDISRVIGIVEHPELSDGEASFIASLLAAGTAIPESSSSSDESPTNPQDTEPVVLPDFAAKQFAEYILGQADNQTEPSTHETADVPGAHPPEPDEPDWEKMYWHPGKIDPKGARADEIRDSGQKDQSDNYLPAEPSPPKEAPDDPWPEAGGRGLRRKLRGLGTAVMAVAVGLFAGGASQSVTAAEEDAPVHSSSASAAPAPDRQPASGEQAAPVKPDEAEPTLPALPPEQPPAIETQEQPAEAIVKVVKIEPGRASWVWNIIQTELTGSYGAVVDADIDVNKAAQLVLDLLVEDNSFDSPDEFSGLDLGYELKFSKRTFDVIQKFRAQTANRALGYTVS